MSSADKNQTTTVRLSNLFSLKDLKQALSDRDRCNSNLTIQKPFELSKRPKSPRIPSLETCLPLLNVSFDLLALLRVEIVTLVVVTCPNRYAI